MTIAMCYLSPEGVVLGADSTASFSVAGGGYHYLNHAQKLFEVGENGTIAMLTWGLSGLGSTSYRTLIARLADDFAQASPASIEEAATRWIELFWPAFSQGELAPHVARC